MYVYTCPSNGWRGDVWLPVGVELQDWGHLCYVTGVAIGETPPEAPVRQEITAPAISVPVSNERLKELGFTKLVRRDEGVYENVTALDHEKRYFKRDDKDSVPDLRRRIDD